MGGRNPAELALGPMLVGTIFNICLYGILIAQTYSYYVERRHASERYWIKYLVGFLFLGDTANSAFMLTYLYSTLINRFGDISALHSATWVFLTEPATAGIVAGCVQLFYAWRVHVLIENTWITMFISIFAVTGTLSAIGTAIAGGIIPEFLQWHKFEVIVVLWLGAAILTDFTITASLVWFLHTRKTGSPVTDDFVNRLIKTILQTGMLTSAVACIDLLAFILDRDGTHLMFNIPLSKLYTNSFMSMLNSRINETNSTGRHSAPEGGLQLTTVCQLTTSTTQDTFRHGNCFDDQSRNV